MSVKSSINRFSYDALLELRAASAAAMTSTTATTALDLNLLASYWASGDNSSPFQFAAVVEVSAQADGATPTILTLETAVAGDSTFAGTVTTILSKNVVGTGRVVLPIVREHLVKAVAAYVRVKFTQPGSGSPSTTAAVYVAPFVGD